MMSWMVMLVSAIVFTTIDAPVHISDSLYYSVLDADELLSEKSVSDEISITVPDKPPMSLVFRSTCNEARGMLFSCSDQGGIIDSLQVYYWNSEGFEWWNCLIDTTGVIVINIGRTEGFGRGSADTLTIGDDGYFFHVGIDFR